MTKKILQIFSLLAVMLMVGVSSAWAEQPLTVPFQFGYAKWGENTSFSGTEKDEVSQTEFNVVCTYTRKGSSLYANTTSIRFYKDNTLTFEAPLGYKITAISFNVTAYKSDITTDVGTCTSTSSELSWAGTANSVTFTRSGSGYATIAGASVTLQASEIVHVTGVALDQTSATIEEGKSLTLEPTISPSNADDKRVTWSSSDETVATVDNGVVTAIKAGSTTITVTTTDGSFQATCDVTVEAQSPYASYYTSNIGLTTEGGTSASTATAEISGESYDAIKAGTNSVKGAMQITVPQYTTKLHFHALGWNNEDVELTVKQDETEIATLDLIKDAGFASSTPFTLSGTPNLYHYSVDVSSYTNTGAAIITLEATTKNRFLVFGVNVEMSQPLNVTLANSGYSTFSSTFSVEIPDNVSAFYATGVDESTVAMTKVNGKIPANSGVVLRGEGNANLTFAVTTEATKLEGNKLVAVADAITLAPTTTVNTKTYTNYVFKNGQFHTFTNGATVNVGAGKCYLQIEQSLPAKDLVLDFGDATGVATVVSAKFEDGSIYNLAGQKVGADYKGIIIVNGKKMLNK